MSGVPFAYPDAEKRALVPGETAPDSGTPLGENAGDPTVIFTTTLNGVVTWNFGDGNHDTTNTGGATHTYAANGTFKAWASNGYESETVSVTIAGA